MLRKLNVFCMPSLREAFGVATLEAQACGAPVIASNVGDLLETIKDGKTGFLVKPKNPSAIADKLLFLYKNPSIRKNMAIQGRKFVAQYYNWDKNV